MTGTSLFIIAPARLLTVNAMRRLHYRERAEIDKAWRHAAAVEARVAGLPAFETVEIHVYPVQRLSALADLGAHLPVAKAAIDGLVDARVIANDTPDVVTILTFHAPVRGPDALGLVLVGDLA